MMNTVTIVGRLIKEPEIIRLENGKNVSNITIAVSINVKNKEGIYETDFIDVNLCDLVAEKTTEYCKKGDIIGVKGRLVSEFVDNSRVMKLIAEKITFLSSKKEDE